MRSLALLCLVACSAPTPPVPVAPPPPPKPLTPDSARELAQAVALRDGGILARTAGGGLVRFGSTLHVQTERAARATSIAIDGERAFAAFEDGSVAELDPTTLAPTPIARVRGRPLWLALRGPELVVFVQPSAAHAYSVEIKRLDTGATRSIAIPNDHSEAMEIAAPATFARDSNALWFGIDAGEWGGFVGRVDLAAGTLIHVAHDDDVYGFLAVGDRMLAHGGSVHMGITDGYVAVLAGKASQIVWRAEWGDKSGERPARSSAGGAAEVEDKPQTPPPVPVVRMVVEDDHYLILLWNELYRVDAGFKSWTLVAKLAARVHPGRPDAVGSYPAATALLQLGKRIVIATVRDGLFELRGDQLVKVD